MRKCERKRPRVNLLADPKLKGILLLLLLLIVHLEYTVDFEGDEKEKKIVFIPVSSRDSLSLSVVFFFCWGKRFFGRLDFPSE